MSVISAFILANLRYILPIAGFLAGIIGLYLKGYSAGSSAIKAEVHKAEDELNGQIQKTEAQNQNIENQREQDAQKLNAVDAIPELISLWNKLSEKTSSDRTKKDS